MFAPTLDQVVIEITEAEKLRDDCLLGVNKIIREYTGRWYRGGARTGTDEDANPEPFSYSFVSNILTSLVYENPSAVVEARRIIGHDEFAQAMQSGLRAWITDVNYKRELEKAVVDFLFFHGVLMHFIEDDTRWSDGAVRPNVKRIDFRTWFADSLASGIGSDEFEGHWYYVDLDELLADPAISPDAAAKLRPTNTSNPLNMDKDVSRDPFTTSSPSNLKRDRVKVYSLWFRRSNTIRIFTKDPKLELYPERPYYGPPTGPYSVFQAYPVPGQIYPLSPLVAVRDQVMDLQTHARATARSAAARKTIVIVDSTHANLAEDVKNSEDREVIAVTGFSSTQATQLEFGGVSSQQYEYLNNLRQILREHSGLTETQRGNVSNSTATESQIAADALNNRVEYLKSRVRDGAMNSLYSVGWFLFHTPGVIIPVNRRDPLTGMQSEGLFFGGQFPGENSGTWMDYSVKIEPLSLQRVSEQIIQRRALDFSNFIMQVAPMMPQIPWIRWLEVIRMVGEALNQDNTDAFLIPEVLGLFGQPPMIPPSQVLGPDGDPPNRYSIPGQGFKPRPGDNPNSNAPLIDENRAEMSKPYGDIYGGTQGPSRVNPLLTAGA